ncbi:MAG: alkaline phosphatase PhoX [Pyrinomonadaceae bacterium]
MDRRSFISNITVAGTGLALACGSLGRRAEVLANSGNLSSLRSEGFGDLIPTASKNTGETFLALPKGFEYNVIGKKGNEMSDGRITPTLHDGMHTFKVGSELRIVRNHEQYFGSVPNPGSAIGGGNHYDETAPGGTTTLVIDPKTRTVIRDFVSLSGTLINCCGGPTPWGSWISCEETTLGPTVRTSPRGVKTGGYPKPHGYCFEVSASANNNIPPVPLKAMGRFTHEAIAVDRKSGIVYLTEDFLASGFYRFLPKRNKRLAEGGELQMLAIKGMPDHDTRTGQKQGMVFEATWVTIDNPDPAEADIDPSAVFKQGKAKGGATFARLEGCCADRDGNVYFVSTNGGDAKGGQIWRYAPGKKEVGRLTLLFESPDREILDMPDNICLMPKSNLLFICEDSDYVGLGGTPDNFVRMLTPNGRIADFAKNIAPNFEKGEFAGSTFSPDGKTLFVNIQPLGATFAVWGDWSKFKALN